MIKELKKLPLFERVDSKIIKELIVSGQITKGSYPKDVTVHEQYSKCQGIDIVGSGKLIAYSLAANGYETIVFEFTKGDIIGANLLLGNLNKYPMNIYCTANSTLFHVSKKAVIDLLREYNFVIPFVKSLSLNSQGMNQRIAMYTQKSLRENLVDYLTALSAEQDSKSIILPMSKKQLADHLGVRRPSLFRELRYMKEEGLVEINNRAIEILFL
ncbi:MAG: Crp/Fnr family transcriptional regulator [Tissierellia bacterium]|nr:Crp/Fnr family transcriptional regulator [Tissierellia bacterium]